AFAFAELLEQVVGLDRAPFLGDQLQHPRADRRQPQPALARGALHRGDESLGVVHVVLWIGAGIAVPGHAAMIALQEPRLRRDRMPGLRRVAARGLPLPRALCARGGAAAQRLAAAGPAGAATGCRPWGGSGRGRRAYSGIFALAASMRFNAASRPGRDTVRPISGEAWAPVIAPRIGCATLPMPSSSAAAVSCSAAVIASGVQSANAASRSRASASGARAAAPRCLATAFSS